MEYDMRSTEPISASDALFRRSDRHSFPKNRQGCFGKRSFQPHMACLMQFHAPDMTVFSIITAVFSQITGGGPGRGPGGTRSGDDSGDPLPREDSPAQDRSPGYRMLPPAIAERLLNFLKHVKNTSEEEFVMTDIKGCNDEKIENRIPEGLEIIPDGVPDGVSQ